MGIRKFFKLAAGGGHTGPGEFIAQVEDAFAASLNSDFLFDHNGVLVTFAASDDFVVVGLAGDEFRGVENLRFVLAAGQVAIDINLNIDGSFDQQTSGGFDGNRSLASSLALASGLTLASRSLGALAHRGLSDRSLSTLTHGSLGAFAHRSLATLAHGSLTALAHRSLAALAIAGIINNATVNNVAGAVDRAANAAIAGAVNDSTAATVAAGAVNNAAAAAEAAGAVNNSTAAAIAGAVSHATATTAAATVSYDGAAVPVAGGRFRAGSQQSCQNQAVHRVISR